MNICELIENQNNNNEDSNNNDDISNVNNNNNNDNVDQQTTVNTTIDTANNINNTTTTTTTSETTSDNNNNNNNGNQNTDKYSLIESGDSHDNGHDLVPLHLTDSTSNNDENFDDLFILDKFFKLCEAQKLDLAIKYVMPALESCATQDEYMKVFAYVRNACFFNDVILRSLWIEQIPNVVQYFRNQNLLDENLNTEIAIIISNLMQYTSYQVRKIASATLVTLIERNLIEASKIEQYVIPCLLNLVNENNDDINIECVSLFGKLAPLIGRELTVKHLLVPFCRLCSSPVFHTRKVCATNIGEIATIVSSKEVEEYLLPHFSEFIKDQVWAIRKVCAEIFANIANKCTRKTRESILTECFIRLLEDSSRWVKISAYKTLGSFIATFLKDENNDRSDSILASTNSAAYTARQLEQNDAKIFYNKNDKKLILSTLLTTKSSSSSSSTSSGNGGSKNQQSLSIRLENEADENEPAKKTTTTPIVINTSTATINTTQLIATSTPSSSSSTLFDKKHEASQKLIDENNYVELQNSNNNNSNNGASINLNNGEFKSVMQYTNFLYWRDSLPELKFDENDENRANINDNNNNNNNNNSNEKNELEIDVDEEVDLYKSEKARRKSGTLVFRDFSGSLSNNKNEATPSQISLTAVLNYNDSYIANQKKEQQQQQQQQQQLIDEQKLSSSSSSSLGNVLNNELNEQDIVPPRLLSYFITMVDMNAQTSLDSEMNYNCAFNFPAIAHTLGPSYWKYIKDLYKRLAEDVNWKVRQTLAYSIHELAQILGTEVTQTDLMPIFDSYIKDVDEVRIGIVSNLSKFLRILKMEYRKAYMPKLIDFLKMDNQRNWRFRNELGLQISEFVDLFPADCIANFIQPVAFTLALDKVAEVRLTAVGALTQILKQLVLLNEIHYRKNFVEDAIRTFANSEKWTFRQL